MTQKCLGSHWPSGRPLIGWIPLALLMMLGACTPPSMDNNAEKTATTAPVDFAHLERRSSPNDYLVCDPAHCPNAAADRASPVFDLPAPELLAATHALLERQPRTKILAEDRLRLVAEQRTAVFGFPDRIDIRIFALGPDRSGIAVYSRSIYGYYDFGANRRRIEAWLAALAGQIGR